MNNNSFQNIIPSYYKGYYEGIALMVGNVAFFVLIIFCIYTGVTKKLDISQISFCWGGVMCGMVVIYFGLCYVVGKDTSRVYTKNVIDVLKEIKPKEDGIFFTLIEKRIVQFFTGLTFLIISSIVILHFFPIKLS